MISDWRIDVIFRESVHYTDTGIVTVVALLYSIVLRGILYGSCKTIFVKILDSFDFLRLDDLKLRDLASLWSFKLIKM